MTKVVKTKAELYLHLDECLRFLRRSSEFFDSGELAEAKRLAVTIRVLLHDTKSSKSLLGLLGLKSSMAFIDSTLLPELRNAEWPSKLLMVQLCGNGPAKYVAPLESFPGISRSRLIFFPEWWNDIVINTKTRKFSRRELITTLANQDGGAHVDELVDEGYASLVRSGDGFVTTKDWKGADVPISSIELYTTRQIAFEIVKSIERKLARG